jgi:hypothetical protein
MKGRDFQPGTGQGDGMARMGVNHGPGGGESFIYGEMEAPFA